MLDNMTLEELTEVERIGSEKGWVAPLSEEEVDYFAYLRTVFKRYNIVPSKATRLEYNFVTQVAESEFYLQRTNA